MRSLQSPMCSMEAILAPSYNSEVCFKVAGLWMSPSVWFLEMLWLCVVLHDLNVPRAPFWVGFQAFRFTVALYRMRHGAMGNLRKVWGLPDTRLCVCRSSNTTQQLGRHKTINRQWLTSMETGKLLNSKERLTVWLEEKCASGLITPLQQL